MALKFRLTGLAETFVDEIECPCCGVEGKDDQNFSTELTRVTYDGIVVVAECKICGEIFVPGLQKLGIIDPNELRDAVKKDHVVSGEPILENFEMVELNTERLNAIRKGMIH